MIQEATQADVSFAFSQFSPLSGGLDSQGRNATISSVENNVKKGIHSQDEGEYVGRRISKKFRNLGRFSGTVVSYNK